MYAKAVPHWQASHAHRKPNVRNMYWRRSETLAGRLHLAEA